MKSIKKSLFLGIFLFSFLFGNEIITIGVTPNPFEFLFKHMKDDFKAKGYDLKIVQFTDYILPNKALENKDLDANLFQHKPYLDEYNKEQKTHLVAITPIVITPMGVFSNKIKDLKDLKDGAKVSVPSDPTNETRALELLEKAGLIAFKDSKNPLKTPLDIAKNPKKLKIVELKAAQLPRSLEDVDIAVINANYALGAGLNPKKDSIFLEDKNSPYVNYIVVRPEDKDSKKTKIIDEVMRSKKLRDFIEKEYKDILIPAF